MGWVQVLVLVLVLVQVQVQVPVSPVIVFLDVRAMLYVVIDGMKGVARPQWNQGGAWLE